MRLEALAPRRWIVLSHTRLGVAAPHQRSGARNTIALELAAITGREGIQFFRPTPRKQPEIACPHAAAAEAAADGTTE